MYMTICLSHIAGSETVHYNFGRKKIFEPENILALNEVGLLYNQICNIIKLHQTKIVSTVSIATYFEIIMSHHLGSFTFIVRWTQLLIAE